MASKSHLVVSDGILKDWSAAHLKKCGWYLDTPLKRPPMFDVAFRNSVQPDLLGVEVVSSKSLEKVGGKKVKKTRGNKATPTMAVEVPIADPITPVAADLPSSSKVVGPSNASRTITVVYSQPSSSVLASQQLLKRKTTLATAASGSTSAIQSSMCLMENTSISTIMEVGVSRPFLLDSHLFVKKVKGGEELLPHSSTCPHSRFDLVIAHIADGMHVTNISSLPHAVPKWNLYNEADVEALFEFAFIFVHNDGGVLLFMPEYQPIRKAPSSFIFRSQNEQSGAVVRVEKDDILFNFVASDTQLMNGSKPWRGAREKDTLFMQVLIEALTSTGSVVFDTRANTGASIHACRNSDPHIIALETDNLLFATVLAPLKDIVRVVVPHQVSSLIFDDKEGPLRRVAKRNQLN